MSSHSSPAPFTRAISRVLATVSVAFVVTQLDVTIVNVALASIGAQLHASVAGLQWIVDAYALALAALMLSAGVLGDRLSPRRLFAGGLMLFAFASLACGLAPNAALLVAARAVQGVGAAAMLPNSLALLNRACAHDVHLRARAVGLWTASGAIAIAAGPIVGGMLIAALGWRSVFLVNLPICAAGLFATFAWVPRRQHERPHSRQPVGIDLPGQCAALVALIAFTGAVIEARPLGFGHPLILGGFGVSVIASMLFILIEAKSAAPMLPLALLRDSTFSSTVLFGACVNTAYYGMIFVLSLFLQRAHGDTPLQAGLAFLPLTGGFLASNVVSGWVVGRYGPRLPMTVGAAVAALGYAMLHTVQAHTPYAALVVPFLLIPGGMGVAVPAMTTAVLASVKPDRAGTASAVLNTARQAGGAVGVAAFGTLASGSGAQAVVDGLRSSAAIALALLVVAVMLACRVHPQSHARDQGADTRTRSTTLR